MSYKFLKEELKNQVLHVVINRPDVHNAFNPELIGEFIDCFTQINTRDEVRVVVLRGEGKSFSAGADLNWMKSLKDYGLSENLEDSKKLALMFRTIDQCMKPIIGVVQGPAYGGGVGIVSVCDYVIASDAAKFSFSEVKLGLIPAVISPYVVRKIGESYARAYFFSGALFGVQEALRMGLVHEVCVAERLAATVEEKAEMFLKAAPKAASECKLFLNTLCQMLATQDRKIINGIEQFTCESIARIRVTSEAQQGMAALLEKTTPTWTGKN
jgi:methylglutaconyl-CoA hydratase